MYRNNIEGTTFTDIDLSYLSSFIFKKTRFLDFKPSKKVIVEEEPDDIDVYDIGNLWDSPRLLFLNEECGNLIVENLLEILNKRRNQTFHNSP